MITIIFNIIIIWITIEDQVPDTIGRYKRCLHTMFWCWQCWKWWPHDIHITMETIAEGSNVSTQVPVLFLTWHGDNLSGQRWPLIMDHDAFFHFYHLWAWCNNVCWGPTEGLIVIRKVQIQTRFQCHSTWNYHFQSLSNAMTVGFWGQLRLCLWKHCLFFCISFDLFSAFLRNITFSDLKQWNDSWLLGPTEALPLEALPSQKESSNIYSCSGYSSFSSSF